MAQQLLDCVPMMAVLAVGGMLVAVCRWCLKNGAAALAGQNNK
jgi:hypothetical protein